VIVMIGRSQATIGMIVAMIYDDPHDVRGRSSRRSWAIIVMIHDDHRDDLGDRRDVHRRSSHDPRRSS
jgi:hypothetical protein